MQWFPVLNRRTEIPKSFSHQRILLQSEFCTQRALARVEHDAMNLFAFIPSGTSQTRHFVSNSCSSLFAVPGRMTVVL